MLAKMMMVMVLVFLLTNFIRVILGIQELLEYSNADWCYLHDYDHNPSMLIYIMDFTARFLVILNSSINFLIYCMVGSKFRGRLLEMLKLKQEEDLTRRDTQLSCFRFVGLVTLNDELLLMTTQDFTYLHAYLKEYPS